MDRRLFSSNFFVYKYYSPELDVYYIGSHHCRGSRWGTCNTKECRYKSSSVEVRRLREERPTATWEMFILGWAQDEDSLRMMELSWIRRFIRDPKCLNKRVSSPRRKGAGSGRRRFVKMIDPRGGAHKPRTEHFMELLAAGWRYGGKGHTLSVRNDELALECIISVSTLCRNIHQVIKTDWAYGSCCDYEFISVGRFLETLKESATQSASPLEALDTEWPLFLEEY